MSAALAALIADQAQDMRTGNYARDVINPLALQHLVIADEDGVARFALTRRRRLSEVQHGTLYAYKRQLCRCAECRAVNAEWQRAYVLRRYGSWQGEYRQRARRRSPQDPPAARPQGLIR